MTPMLDLNQIEIADSWLAHEHKVVLAIVTSTWGSSPRQAGAIMLIRDDGALSGSVSGGCIEGNVISQAMSLFDKPDHLSLSEGVEDETAWSQGLSCGGQIDVMIVPVTDGYIAPSLIKDIASLSSKRQSAYLSFHAKTGKAQLLKGSHEQQEGELQFAIAPRKQLIIIGAGHISQQLAPMALQTDFDVTIIDPRTIFITAERFPNCHLIDTWPETALASITLDNESALIVLTHDARIDDQALIAGLQGNPFHIAALGSQRTHKKRQERLQAAGVSDIDIARIKGPAGLALGAKSPAEIAVSILAEIISEYRSRQSQ